MERRHTATVGVTRIEQVSSMLHELCRVWLSSNLMDASVFVRPLEAVNNLHSKPNLRAGFVSVKTHFTTTQLSERSGLEKSGTRLRMTPAKPT